MPGPKQDAYVFIPSGTDDTLMKLDALHDSFDVRYATRVLSGAFGSVAFIEVEADENVLTTLESKLTKVRNAVNPGTSVGVAIATGPRAPTRWSDKKPVGAYVRIRTQPGRAHAVFDALNGASEFKGSEQYGSALIVGDWDVLIEVDADSLAEVGALIERINREDGVLSTDSAIVINPPTPPDPHAA
jgi:hypothetical protein